MVQRVGRGIALLFQDHGTRRSEWPATGTGHTLPPGRTQYPLYRKLGGSQGRSGQAENLAPPGFDSWTVQPVVSRYTDWATRPTCQKSRNLQYFFFLSFFFLFLFLFFFPLPDFVLADTNETHTEVILHFAATNSRAYPVILELIQPQNKTLSHDDHRAIKLFKGWN